MQVLLHPAHPHQHLPPVLAGPHGTHGLALVCECGIGGQAVAVVESRCGVQLALPLKGVDSRAGGLDGHGDGLPGQRGGEKVRMGEHGLALRKVRHCPGHGLRGRVGVAPHAGVPRRLRKATSTHIVLKGPFGSLPRVFHAHRAAPSGRLDRRVRRESRRQRLLAPALAQRLPVDVALVGAGHQRRPRRQMGIAPGIAEAARVHRRLDLRPPRGEGIDDAARHPRDLEAPVRVGLLDAVAQLLQPARQLAAIDHAGEHLARVQRLVGHGAPFAVPSLHHVGNHRVGVELRIEIARGVVGEGGGHHLLAARVNQEPGLWVLHAGLDRRRLQPRQGALHRRIVRGGDGCVVAQQRDQGYGFLLIHESPLTDALFLLVSKSEEVTTT